MLYEVMREVNNYFIREQYSGSFSIIKGQLEFPFTITKGQYYLIENSEYNDGLHQYEVENDTLTDEVFNGRISKCVVPKKFVDLVLDIDEWIKKYQSSVQSPFTSESFGGYSYSKATNSSGSSVDWRDVFKTQLNTWRKV